jgi:hypothetical protein
VEATNPDNREKRCTFDVRFIQVSLFVGTSLTGKEGFMNIRFAVLIFAALFLVNSIGVVSAQENTSLQLDSLDTSSIAAGSFLENEAGICAYGQIGFVNLDLAENAYKNIERKTDDYLIGSVALLDYPESDDVHVYLDTSGWLIAYYLKEEYPSKIIDWVEYRNSATITTKLEDAMALVCAEMGQFLPTIGFYDFRYPDANEMMICIDEKPNSGTETFFITIPSTDYFVFSRTWSHAARKHGYSGAVTKILIDDVLLNSFSRGNGGPHTWTIHEGEISAIQLSPDVRHMVSVTNGSSDMDCYVAVVLIYRYQP